MVDMLKSARDEDQRKRDEAQFYSVQQQLDELRRQLKENLARQQWFEELYKQSEGKVSQLQSAQDRMLHDIAQALQARQIDDSRTKAQVAELSQRIESPDKQIKELRAQIIGLGDQRKGDRDVDVAVSRQIEDLQRQIRDVNAHVSKVADANKQVRDVIAELDAAIGEVRQEAMHIAELQRMEEHRLRRQGVELQNLFEALRQQFTEVAAKSQRVDDVRHQLSERIDTLEESMAPMRLVEENMRKDIEGIQKLSTQQHLAQQERLETVRVQVESQLGEVRQLTDQRTDRFMSRFADLDERLRLVDQTLGEIPARFEALERRDEVIGTEADSMEEWLVTRQLVAMEAVLDDVRKRRVDRAPALNPNPRPDPVDSTPGSIYNPSGLLKNVRDAKPPTRSEE